jgi:cobalt-zinc-cadmium efflux system outer membrane protein
VKPFPVGSCLIAAVLAAGGCSTNAVDDLPLPDPMAPALAAEALAKTQGIDLSAPLDSQSVASIAVLSNPELRAMRAREGVAEAQVFAAGLIPDPSFSVAADYPRNDAGLVTAVAAAVGIDVAALLRRPATQRAARAELDALHLDIAWAEWLTSEQARIQAIRIPYLERSKRLTAELRQLADAELSRSLEAMMRGDLPAASLETHRLAAADAAARDRDTENLLAQARLDLNRTLGLDPRQSLEIASTVTSNIVVQEIDELYRQSVLQRADLQGMRAGYEATAARQSLAVLGRYPLPVVDVNATRDTGAVRTLGPGVSLTLPVWNRGRGDRAIANASRTQWRAEYMARLQTVHADIASFHTALKIAQKQVREVADEIRPLAAQVDAAGRAVERGDLSQSAGAVARLALLDKQIVESGLSMAVAELSIALEIATGFRLEPES